MRDHHTNTEADAAKADRLADLGWVSAEWKPGDVAMVTIPGSGERLMVRYDTGIERGWYHEFGQNDEGKAHYSDDFSARGAIARPLVLIDPEDREQVERLRDMWDAAHKEQEGYAPAPSKKGERGNCLQQALREFANPTPPKPEEPQGLGAVVVDADDRIWIHDPTAPTTHHWRSRDVGRAWHNVEAVRVLSEGWAAYTDEPLADWERDLLRGERS